MREEPLRIDITSAIENARLRPFHLRLVALCACMLFFDGFDLQAISFAAPQVTAALGISKVALGSIFSAGQFGLAAGALCFGLAGDHWGRKRVFVLCGVLFALSSLGTATAHGTTSLILWRLAAGFGLGGATPIAITIATDYCPKRVRAALTMIMYCGFTIGGVAAGAANAAVLKFGWQAVFLIGGTLPLLLAPVLIAALPESLNYLVARPARRAEVARILGRIAPEESHPPDAEFTMPHAFEERIQLPELFRHGYAPRTILLWSAFFVSLITLFSFSNWLPSLLASLGITPAQVVVMSAVGQFGGLLGTVSAARLIVFHRPFRLAALGYVLSAAVLIALGSVGSRYVALVAIGFLLNFILIGVQNVMNAMSGSLYPPKMRATGVGWAIGIGRVGGILGPAVTGGLLALDWAPSQLFMLSAVPAVITGVIVFGLSRVVAEGTAQRRGVAGGVAPHMEQGQA